MNRKDLPRLRLSDRSSSAMRCICHTLAPDITHPWHSAATSAHPRLPACLRPAREQHLLRKWQRLSEGQLLLEIHHPQIARPLWAYFVRAAPGKTFQSTSSAERRHSRSGGRGARPECTEIETVPLRVAKGSGLSASGVQATKRMS